MSEREAILQLLNNLDGLWLGQYPLELAERWQAWLAKYDDATLNAAFCAVKADGIRTKRKWGPKAPEFISACDRVLNAPRTATPQEQAGDARCAEDLDALKQRDPERWNAQMRVSRALAARDGSREREDDYYEAVRAARGY